MHKNGKELYCGIFLIVKFFLFLPIFDLWMGELGKSITSGETNSSTIIDCIFETSWNPDQYF